MEYLLQIPHELPDDIERIAILDHCAYTIRSADVDDDFLEDLSETFCTLEEKFNLALHRTSSHPLTGEIGRLNQARLESIQSIQNGLEYFLTYEEPEKVESAEVIRPLFNNCLGNLPNRKRVTYTAAIDNFLKYANDSHAVQALEILEMSKKIKNLQSVHLDFISLTGERATSQELDSTPLLKTIRHEMHNIYEVLERYLFYKLYKEEEGYAELTMKLNGRIREILTIARSRFTSKQ